eukprot:TRINITY_DN368_c0_g3_i1.p1 TRINITY_DN368_c0_g3~~TRINITY_DN368_c0_g3_i1.p1  ORF type:complete len:183 (-),score=31.00 TRINITY_DN368_c0_g3_i1:606-1154(-)
METKAGTAPSALGRVYGLPPTKFCKSSKSISIHPPTNGHSNLASPSRSYTTTGSESTGPYQNIQVHNQVPNNIQFVKESEKCENRSQVTVRNSPPNSTTPTDEAKILGAKTRMVGFYRIEKGATVWIHGANAELFAIVDKKGKHHEGVTKFTVRGTGVRVVIDEMVCRVSDDVKEKATQSEM